MEGILSNLLKTNREKTKSTMLSSSISYSSSTRQTDITHAWLLIQCIYLFIIKIEIFIMKIFFFSIEISRNISFGNLYSKNSSSLSKIYFITSYKNTTNSYFDYLE